MRSVLPILALVIGAPAAAIGSPSEARPLLSGDAAGSAERPRILGDLAAVEELCRLVTPAADSDPHADVPDAQRDATHAVYRVRIPPSGFSLAPGSDLALNLDRPLLALDEELALSVLDRDEGVFEADDAIIAAARRAVEAKAAALDITFRLEGRDADLPACFPQAKRKAFGLRAEPLTYTLVTAAGGKTLAHSRTRRWKELQDWLQPGAATVRMDVQVRTGAVDPKVLQAQLPVEAMNQCLEAVVSSVAGTGMVSLSAELTRSGELAQLAPEVQSFEDQAVVDCLVDALAQLRTRGSKSAARVAVVVSVERDG